MTLDELWKEAFEMMLEEWRAAETASLYFKDNDHSLRMIRLIRETGEQLYKSRLNKAAVLEESDVVAVGEDERYL